jgi:hypothetical protein
MGIRFGLIFLGLSVFQFSEAATLSCRDLQDRVAIDSDAFRGSGTLTYMKNQKAYSSCNSISTCAGGNEDKIMKFLDCMYDKSKPKKKEKIDVLKAIPKTNSHLNSRPLTANDDNPELCSKTGSQDGRDLCRKCEAEASKNGSFEQKLFESCIFNSPAKDQITDKEYAKDSDSQKANENANASDEKNSLNSKQCSANLKNAVASCKTKVQAAAKEQCDPKSNNSLKNTMSLVSQMGTGLAAMKAADLKQACATKAKIDVLTNSAVSAYNSTCSWAKSSCRSNCDDLFAEDKFKDCGKEEIESAKEDALQACEVNQSGEEAMKSGAMALRSGLDLKQCEVLFGNSADLAARCQADPNAPGCSGGGPVNCFQSGTDTNPVCACLGNPNSPSCQTFTGAGPVAINYGSDGPSMSGDMPQLPDVGQETPENLAKRQGDEAPSEEGGRKGGAAGSGSGDVSGGGADANSKGGDSLTSKLKNMFSGFFGNAGPAPMQAGGSSSDNSGNSKGDKEGNGFYGRPNLPAGKYDPLQRRFISSTVGPDGINSANQDIFVIIKQGFQKVEQSPNPLKH